MNTTNSTLEASQPSSKTPPSKVPLAKTGVSAFVALIVLAILVCALAAMRGDAPVFTNRPEDWFTWVRAEKLWGGIFACAIAVFAIGLTGTLITTLRGKPARQAEPRQPAPKSAPKASPAMAAPAAVAAAPESGLPTSDGLTIMPQTEAAPAEPAPVEAPLRSEPRGSLRFDASRIASLTSAATATDQTASPPYNDADDLTTPVMAHTSAAPELVSLEPAIFHDNASDSFLSRSSSIDVSDVDTSGVDTSGFDPAAALSETHGLNISRSEPETSPEANPETSNVVPIRPDLVADPVADTPAPDFSVTAHDPMEAALLTEPVTLPSPAPQSDIQAVIQSAMQFIDSPVVAAPVVAAPVVAAPVVAAPVVTAPEPQPTPSPILAIATPEQVETIQMPTPIADGESEIRQAVHTALSVWPDTTRAIAADELSVRVAHLYYDPNPQSRQIFHLIGSGDLGAAAGALQLQADALAQDGHSLEAAELWRVYGALHMGRDDGRAMTAYAKVSELDPGDANIHLYLTRRYQMAGDSAKLLPVIGRALAVISDPAVRTELLTPFADLHMKAGNVQIAGDALEELSRLHETTAYLRPDDIAARSAHAIALARLAQAREMQGAFDKAGPLYKKAHQVFADLSAQKPEHPGLRAMADNALKDANRFGA